jgi:hypothetical protein
VRPVINDGFKWQLMCATHASLKMEKEIVCSRRKKSDKAKDKQQRNGSFSQKHVRIQQELSARAKERVACNLG